MGWVSKLSGSIVALDSAPLIYFVEEHPIFLPVVDLFFQALARCEIEVVTSALILTEVLVHPYRSGNQVLAKLYSDILQRTPNLRVLNVTPGIAEEAVRIRGLYGLKTPNSIQLATARIAGATTFLTNDAGVRAIPGISPILLKDLLTGTQAY